MKAQTRLQKAVWECNIHEKRIRDMQEKLSPFFPLSLNVYVSLINQTLYLGYIEIFTNRFVKIFNCINKKIFPNFLELLGEDSFQKSFIDQLNRLETLAILPSVEVWQTFDNIRSYMAYAALEPSDLTISHLNTCYEKSTELLDVWCRLQQEINERIS